MMFLLVALAAGCDSNALDSGRDYGPRAGSAHLPGEYERYVRLERTKAKTQNQEFLAPMETGIDKVPTLADPDSLAQGGPAVAQTAPEAVPSAPPEDSVAGNFKYSRGYRDPLLPSAIESEEGSVSAKKLPTDIVEANGMDSTNLDPYSRRSNHFQIAAPAGPLGELERQRESRERHGETNTSGPVSQPHTTDSGEADTSGLIGSNTDGSE